MESLIVPPSNPILSHVLEQIAGVGVLDEISNHPGAVRHYIYHRGRHQHDDMTSRDSLLFFVYDQERHGPQSGFRCCIVHADYRLTAAVKVDGEAEDEIDRLEAYIPDGHMEVVVLGERSMVGPGDD